MSDRAQGPGPDPRRERSSGPWPIREADVWSALARWRSEGRCFVMMTVVSSRGFTPRKAGAHMLVDEHGETVGTVGGGAIEQEALVRARAMFGAGAETGALDRHLTRELGMCCGGEMSIFFERIGPAPRLFIFGAGYIAKPLAAIAAGCGFEVTVVDGRPEWANDERFPTSRVVVQMAEDYARQLENRPSDYAVVVTHDHALDQRLVQILLSRPIAFLGMIGSIPKQRKFALRLRARGFSDAVIARLRTPLGVAIAATTPEEIAVSAMGEIIAFRRGASRAPQWPPPRAGAGVDDRAGLDQAANVPGAPLQEEGDG